MEWKRTILGIKISFNNSMTGQGWMSFPCGSDMGHMGERQYGATLSPPFTQKELRGWRCEPNEREDCHRLRGWGKNFKQPASNKEQVSIKEVATGEIHWGYHWETHRNIPLEEESAWAHCHTQRVPSQITVHASEIRSFLLLTCSPYFPPPTLIGPEKT